MLTVMLFPVRKMSYERENAEKNNDCWNKKGDLPIVEDCIHEQVASPARRAPHGSKLLGGGTASRRIVIACWPRDAVLRRFRATPRRVSSAGRGSGRKPRREWRIEPRLGRWFPEIRPLNMLAACGRTCTGAAGRRDHDAADHVP